MEENAVQAAAHAAKLAEEKTALEEAKRLADEQAIAMRASHAEQQRLLQEEAEAARVLTAQLAQQREEDAAANAAASAEQARQLKKEAGIAVMRLASGLGAGFGSTPPLPQERHARRPCWCCKLAREDYAVHRTRDQKKPSTFWGRSNGGPFEWL